MIIFQDWHVKMLLPWTDDPSGLQPAILFTFTPEKSIEIVERIPRRSDWQKPWIYFSGDCRVLSYNPTMSTSPPWQLYADNLITCSYNFKFKFHTSKLNISSNLFAQTDNSCIVLAKWGKYCGKHLKAGAKKRICLSR